MMTEDTILEKQFLGHVVRADREAMGFSQAELQRRVRELAIVNSNKLSEEVKAQLLATNNYYVKNDTGYVSVPISSKCISNIERGVTRYLYKPEVELIAIALNQDPERYFNLEINPLNLLTNNTTDDTQNSWFDKSIEFDPEYRQAGISILSFFSEVVTSEYADQDVRVGILQEGNTVTLRVETPDGLILKEIEKTLEKYGLVVMGNAPVESLSNNRDLIRDLKTKLEVTSLELRLRQENHIEHKKQYETRITSLEEQVKQLHSMIGYNLANYESLVGVIKSLVGNEQLIQKIESSLSVINSIVKSEYSEESERSLDKSIKDIENQSPGLVSRLVSSIETIPASVLANLVSPWVQSFFSSFPK